MSLCENCIHDCVCMYDKPKTYCSFYEEARPHGEWIPKQDSIGGTYYVCSNCGEPCYTLLYTEPEPRDRFCLWCGASMRKEGEAE